MIDNDNTAEQLRACPFCGGSVALTYTDQVDAVSWCAHIECDGCDMDFSRAYCAPNADLAEDEVITAWNTCADSGEAVAWLVVQKNRLSHGPMYRTKEEALACGVADWEIDEVIPLFAHPRATALDVRDAVQRNLLAAAKAYYTRYCVDEADEDGPHWTGCSEQQSIDARELRDAISAAIASREGR